MTRNLYAGASYHPVLRASPADIPARVAEQIAAVLASDFPARARAIAAEIAETGPDVVGFQEACLFELPGSGSARMAVDHTHLEPDAPPVQLAQARELTAGPGASPGPVVLIGDFNTWPDERGRPTYAHLQAAGFADAWSAVGQGPGLTHGHAPDLRNAEACFTSRLDLVLPRGPVVARAARLTGHEPRWRTPSGLWPSDHAGVVVQVEVG